MCVSVCCCTTVGALHWLRRNLGVDDREERERTGYHRLPTEEAADDAASPSHSKDVESGAVFHPHPSESQAKIA